MTITTDLSARHGEKEFSRRPATTKSVAALTLLAGAGLATYGILRRNWFGTAVASGGGYFLYCGVTDLRRPYQGRVRTGFTIAKTRQEIYDFIRNSQNWNRFLQEIQFENRGNAGFGLKIGKRGIEFTSNAEITDEKTAEYIAWASDEQVFEHRGVIHFKDAPGNRGTEVTIAVEYKAPAGPIARSLASLAGRSPEHIVRESLRHLKQLMEAGEIPTTVGQPVGARGIKGAAMRVVHRESAREAEPQQVKLAGD